MSNIFSKIWFPIAVAGSMAAGIATDIQLPPAQKDAQYALYAPAPDTVIYPADGYRQRRRGNFSEYKIADSLLSNIKADSLWEAAADSAALADTLPHLTAKDTLIPPDSLQYTDPFRFKYYVALLDSTEHRYVSDTLLKSYLNAKDSGWMEIFTADSLDHFMLDSTYYADSSYRAALAFQAWYNSLSKEERKKYDQEQKEKRQAAQLDSVMIEKKKKEQYRDSVVKNTPRILSTYAIPTEMHYKQIVKWTQDQDFGDLQDVSIPDTNYNFHFYDYRFQREDVNATWLGVAGSPTQYYNWFKRKSDTGAEFFNAYDSWTYTPKNLEQFNTKTPHTELAYYGTIFDSQEKEYDNLRIFTTQNITPALNFSILFEKWGGGGMLINQKTKNKTFATGINYLGKRYLMNAGFINNTVELGENGGVKNISDIRDTTLEIREVAVNNTSAASVAKKTTFYLNQQFRLAGDSSDFNDPCIFLGHSSEFTSVGRTYTNNNVMDSLGQKTFDNKFYVRLQPFSPISPLSKLDVGIGDRIRTYHKPSAYDTTNVKENSLYAYAGLQGTFIKRYSWQARAHLTFAGDDAGAFDASFNTGATFYPFRKDKTSPMKIGASVSTELSRPYFYQRYNYSLTNANLVWDNDFQYISTTKAQASLSIPYWGLDASVGYALLANNIYYDANAIIHQNTSAMSILSAYLHKDIVLWKLLHLDNRILFQHSSNQEVVPLPTVALNLKYFIQFPVKKDVMDMQIGVNGWVNTRYYAQGWNPSLGVFYNQDETTYRNGPYFDVFVNMQWKTITLFLKFENLGKGWPMDSYDYFSAHRYINTQNSGALAFKLGLFWPFHMSAVENKKVNSSK